MIKEVTNVAEWRKFLSRNEHLVFHTPEYKKFIASAFKVEAKYYTDEKMNTLFPLYCIKHPLGKKVISTGYIEYGGPCGSLDNVGDILNFAYEEFHDVGFIEVRQGLEKFDSVLSKLMLRSVDFKRFLLDLDDEKNTFKNIAKAKRKTIKKAASEGVTCKEIDVSEINVLYKLYCDNMKRFGSPPYSKWYFECFFKHIVNEGLGKVFGAYYEGKLLSALLGFCYQDRIHVIIAVSDFKYQHLRANDAVHWEFMKFGCSNKYKIFDFGRVREDSGQFTYKKRWGARLEDLNHYYLLIKNKGKPVVDPSNPIYKLIIEIWKKIPVFISKRIGHWIRTGLGI